MNLSKYSGCVIAILFSAYFYIWFGELFPSFVYNDYLSYLQIGILLSIFFVGIGTLLIINIQLNKWLVLCAGLANILFIILFLFTNLFWELMVLSLLQGLLFGSWLKTLMNNHSKYLPYLSLGLAISYPIRYVNVAFFENKSFSLDLIPLNGNYFVSLILIFISLVLCGILFFSYAYSTEISTTNHSNQKRYSNEKLFYLLIVSGFITLEVVFVIWSAILKDDSQGIENLIAFPLTFLMIFIFRNYFHNWLKLKSDGWVFIMSLILMFSLGLFYTFDIMILFILGFSFSVSYLSKNISDLSQTSFTVQSLGILSIITAIVMLLISLFVDNYIEFITYMKLPKNVWALSVRQALIKEITTFVAIITISLGFTYVYHRNWNIK